METKTIPDNQIKARFLQLYQNTHVCFEGIGNSLWSVGNCSIKGSFINSGDRGKIYLNDIPALMIKPLKNITDEEAKQIEKSELDLAVNGVYSAKTFLESYEVFGFLIQTECDKLREFGYAVPYLNYSVQDLIDFGWIKLK
jgi:hypothetical protein